MDAIFLRLKPFPFPCLGKILFGLFGILQREDLRKVMELLGLREHHARTLLIHYRWDVERIFELLDQKGRDRLFSEAGIPLQPANNAGSPSSTEVTCNVCYDDVPLSDASKMDCGHNYCNECKQQPFGEKEIL